jgi:hypothetical protein
MRAGSLHSGGVKGCMCWGALFAATHQVLERLLLIGGKSHAHYII